MMRVPHVIGDCTTAAHGQVERRGYADIAAIADRAWRVTHDRCEFFCVLDDASERTLLGWIVGGAPTRVLSSIERSIVAEAIRRLLATWPEDGHAGIREETRVRPPVESWRCDLQLSARGRQRAVLQLFAACVSGWPPQAATGRPDLSEMTLQVRATLPGVACLGEIKAWRPGSLLRLTCSNRDVRVMLDAGGRRLAVAQLGAISAMRAVKVIALGGGGNA